MTRFAALALAALIALPALPAQATEPPGARKVTTAGCANWRLFSS